MVRGPAEAAAKANAREAGRPDARPECGNVPAPRGGAGCVGGPEISRRAAVPGVRLSQFDGVRLRIAARKEIMPNKSTKADKVCELCKVQFSAHAPGPWCHTCVSRILDGLSISDEQLRLTVETVERIRQEAREAKAAGLSLEHTSCPGRYWGLDLGRREG